MTVTANAKESHVISLRSPRWCWLWKQLASKVKLLVKPALIFAQVVKFSFLNNCSPIGAHRNQWRDRKMLGVDDLASLENLTEVFRWSVILPCIINYDHLDTTIITSRTPYIPSSTQCPTPLAIELVSQGFATPYHNLGNHSNACHGTLFGRSDLHLHWRYSYCREPI